MKNNYLHLLMAKIRLNVEDIYSKVEKNYATLKDDINQKNEFGEIPLHVYMRNAYNQDVKIINYLIELKSDLSAKDDQNQTALQLHCKNNHANTKIIELIINNSKNENDLNAQSNSKNTALHFLCINKSCKFKLIKKMIDKKADLNIQNEKAANSPSHLLLRFKEINLEILNFYLENKMDLNLKNSFGDTPLHNLFRNENTKKPIFNYLIFHKKIDLFQKNNDGISPNFLCFRNTNFPDKLLLNISLKDKDLHIPDSKGNSALLFYCERDSPNIEIIHNMIQKKCDLNIKGEYGYSPFHLLCQKENFEMNNISFYLKNGSDPLQMTKFDKNTSFLLLSHSKNFNFDTLKQFINLKANILEENTQFDCIASNYLSNPEFEVESLRYLIENNHCSVNDKIGAERETLLHFVSKNKNVNIDILKYLCEKKADLNSFDNEKKMVSHHIFSRTDCPHDIFYFLIEKKVEMCVGDIHDNLPLIFACENETLDFKLLEKSCQKDYFTKTLFPNNFTPLHSFCKNKNISVEKFKFFIENGSDLQIETLTTKEKPFHIVAKNKNVSVEILDYLIENKCDPNDVDCLGNTPLHILLQNNNPDEEIVKFLLQKISIDNFYNNKFHSLICIYSKNQSLNINILKLLVESGGDLFYKISYYANDVFSDFLENPSLNLDCLKYLNEIDCFFNNGGVSTKIYHLFQNKSLQIEFIKYLIEEVYEKKNRFDLFQYTKILYHATQRNLNFQVLKYLLEKNSDPNQEVSGTTCASNICSNPLLKPEILDLFLEKGMKIKNFYNGNPLIKFFANKYKSFQMKKDFIDKKLGIDFKDNYSTILLHLVSSHKFIPKRLFKYVLQNTKDINLKDNTNKNSFYYCIFHKLLDFARLLIEKKADINSDHFNPLTLHCQTRYIDISFINLLLKKNCSVNVFSNERNLPIHNIINTNNFGIIKLFVENKSELNLLNYTQYTPLMLECSKKNASFHIIKFLVENKSDLNIKGVNNKIAFDLFVENNKLNLDHLTYLFEKKSNLDNHDSENHSPLVFACKFCFYFFKIIFFLIPKR